MSQMTMASTIVAQTMITGVVYNLSRSIKQAWNKGMKRNPSRGGLGGNPGGGGGGQPPSLQGPPLIPQQVPKLQGDVQMMGALLEPFTGD